MTINPVVVLMLEHAVVRNLRKSNSSFYIQPVGFSSSLQVTKTFMRSYVSRMMGDKPWLVARMLNTDYKTQRKKWVNNAWKNVDVVYEHWTLTGFQLVNDDDFDHWDELFQKDKKEFQKYVPFMSKHLIATLAVKYDSFGMSRPLGDLLKGM